MATYYVYSGAGGAGTGADWANAYTTLTLALSGKAAGDVFYIAHDHAESTAAAITLTSPGTQASPCRFLCVDRAGSVPPVSADLRTTATVSTTGASNITLGGVASTSNYWYGVIFQAGSGAAATFNVYTGAAATAIFKNCSLRALGTSGNVNFAGSSPGAYVVLDNTSFQFAAVGQGIGINSGLFFWKNTPAPLLGTIPTVLFVNNANAGFTLVAEGVDLSAAGAGKTFFGTATGSNRITLKDCRLHASVTIATSPVAVGVIRELIRCDSGATNYRSERHHYEGVLTTETTVVRTGGASDGTTPISWRIATTANPEWQCPFECFPISIWNEVTGSPVTVTVEGVWGGGAVPLNDEIWMDVEYLGNASYPLGLFATTTKADILATGTNTTASSEIWGGSMTSFKMTTSVTPEMRGPITVYVRVAKASSTFYIDPKITLN